ncbi:unnamed protein product [Schistosoma turkestanicum]|nr:unnamed protein product [Schistosoma turkestanicum]
MVTLSVSCLLTLASLIIMGAGVDAERKVERAVKRPWLEDLSQNSLSWSYGLAAVSLLPSWITVIILGWFVYPKRFSYGLLVHSAWNWPTLNDLQCHYHRIVDLSAPQIFSSSNPQSSCNITTMSIDYPHSLHSRTLIQSGRNTGNPLSDELNNKILCKPTLLSHVMSRNNQLESGQELLISSSHHSTTLSSDNYGKMSSYDPRSADTISLLSYDQPPSNLLYNPQTTSMMNEFNSVIYSKDGNLTMNDYNSSMHSKTKSIQSNLLGSFHKSTVSSSFFKKESTSRRQQQQQQQCTTNSESHSHLKSTLSNKSLNGQQPSYTNPDTSIWTESKPDEKSFEHDSIIQIARPMKRTRKKVKTDQFVKKLIKSENLFKLSSPFPNIKAKPMSRK